MQKHGVLSVCALMVCLVVLCFATPAVRSRVESGAAAPSFEAETSTARTIAYNAPAACVPNSIPNVIVECTRGTNPATFELQCFDALEAHASSLPGSLLSIDLDTPDNVLVFLISLLGSLADATNTPAVSTLWLDIDLNSTNTGSTNSQAVVDVLRDLNSLLRAEVENAVSNVNIGIVADIEQFNASFGNLDIYSAIGPIDVMWAPLTNAGFAVNQTFAEFTPFNGIPASAVKAVVTGGGICSDGTEYADLIVRDLPNTTFRPFDLQFPSSAGAGVSGMLGAGIAVLVAAVALAG